jgi:predicted histidine transporter YuiF (NhaC family)
MAGKDGSGIGGLAIMALLTLFPGARKFLGASALILFIAGVCLWAYTGGGQLFDETLKMIRLVAFVLIMFSGGFGLFWIGSHFMEMVGNRIADKFGDDDADEEDDEPAPPPPRRRKRQERSAGVGT